MKDKKASSVFVTWFKRSTIPSGLFNDLPEWKRSAIRHLCESAFDKGRRYERDSRKEEFPKGSGTKAFNELFGVENGTRTHN